MKEDEDRLGEKPNFFMLMMIFVSVDFFYCEEEV